MSSTSGALETVDRILNRGGDADDVLRQVVAVLHENAGYPWAGIFFLEAGELALGPEAGTPNESRRTSVPRPRPIHRERRCLSSAERWARCSATCTTAM